MRPSGERFFKSPLFNFPRDETLVFAALSFRERSDDDATDGMIFVNSAEPIDGNVFAIKDLREFLFEIIIFNKVGLVMWRYVTLRDSASWNSRGWNSARLELSHVSVY